MINTLIKQLNDIEGYIPHRDKKDVNVSKVEIAWHIDHVLKVINSVFDTLLSSTPGESDPSTIWELVIKKGRMRRGAGEAPASVKPPASIKAETLLEQLHEAKTNISLGESADPNSQYHHHVFGILDLEDSIRFLEIHTDHHIKIINDILSIR